MKDLVSVIPEFAPEMKEHVAFNDDLLPHVLFGDLTRWVIALYRSSESRTGAAERDAEVLDRTLRYLEERFGNPQDAAAQDLIAVSFLENLHQAGPDLAGITERLGPNLKRWLARLV